MLFKIIHLHKFHNFHLRNGAGLQICALLNQIKFINNFLRCVNPAQTQAGRKNLGEGSQKYNSAFRIIMLYRRKHFALKAKLSIRVILKNGNIILIRQLYQTNTAFLRPCFTGGILKIGNHIDKFNSIIGGQGFFQFFHIHPVIICTDINISGFIGTEGCHCTKVAWAFTNDNITGVNKQLCHKFQALLRTTGYHNFFHPCLNP